jgi:hypothetical protein
MPESPWIKKGRELREDGIGFVVEFVMRWIDDQGGKR